MKYHSYFKDFKPYTIVIFIQLFPSVTRPKPWNAQTSRPRSIDIWKDKQSDFCESLEKKNRLDVWTPSPSATTGMREKRRIGSDCYRLTPFTDGQRVNPHKLVAIRTRGIGVNGIELKTFGTSFFLWTALSNHVINDNKGIS